MTMASKPNASSLGQGKSKMSGKVGKKRTKLHLPQRTIARRKKEQKLQVDESDRLLRLARISAQATATLGSKEKAAQWLRRPNRALGNQAPVDVIDSDIGTRQVKEVLGRIEHGIVS